MTNGGRRSEEKNAEHEPGEPKALRADISQGMTALMAGRITDFDIDRIVKRGRVLLAERGGFDA
ncbi:hypothetical protein PA01_00705 [Azoarcus sp. PA01]|nr:hypothetical protein PA01_19950 [Azoarcus sp. PA01]KON82590.1 hypothetical protein PA01_00705 [Azoarcus sp. PA01]